jgi:hypothetical protein
VKDLEEVQDAKTQVITNQQEVEVEHLKLVVATREIRQVEVETVVLVHFG